MRGLIIASVHFVGLLRRWDWYPLMVGVYDVAEHDGSSGASGIGTHCAEAESMRDWYPHRSQWDRYPLTASTRYEWDGCPSWMQVYSVFEQDGSFGASGIGTHCADAEFM